MIKKTTAILCIIFSFIGVQAQTIRKDQLKEETLPDGNLVKVHVSGRNGDTAAVLQRGDGYWVYIKNVLYGPFETTDALNDSPFDPATNHWQFRGAEGERTVLIVDGVRQSVFDQIWTPNFSKDGTHWGALVKNGNRYALLIDGRPTNFFDVIFYEGQGHLDSFSLAASSPSTAPYFYGSLNRWLAIGYRSMESTSNGEAEFRVVTNNGEGVAYNQVETPDSMIVDPNNDRGDFGYIQYENHLSLDRESAVLSIHLSGNPPEDTHLWINERTYGPYPGGLTAYADNFHPAKAMAADASNWVIKGGNNTVYTRDRVLAYQISGSPQMSRNGRSFSFSFVRDEQEFSYVDGQEVGPFETALDVTFSSSGDHWIAGGRSAEDGLVRLVSKGGVTYGPYTTFPKIAYIDEVNWAGYTLGNNRDGYFLYNGVPTQGPFQLITPQPQGGRLSLVGYQGDQATFIINNQVRLQQSGVRINGVNVIAVSNDLTHWAATTLNLDQSMSFIDNGRAFTGLDVAHNVTVFSSENMDRNAAFLAYPFGDGYFVINGAKYGPYIATSTGAVFSSSGNSWAASGLTRSGVEQLILPGAAPVDFETVTEMKSVRDEDAVIYNAFRDNQWHPGINNVSLGTYNLASINCSPDLARKAFLTVNEGDRKLKTYTVTIDR